MGRGEIGKMYPVSAGDLAVQLAGGFVVGGLAENPLQMLEGFVIATETTRQPARE